MYFNVTYYCTPIAAVGALNTNQSINQIQPLAYRMWSEMCEHGSMATWRSFHDSLPTLGVHVPIVPYLRYLVRRVSLCVRTPLPVSVQIWSTDS